jgi:N-Dimethylarginine dimethylaminohydrolase
MLNINVENEYSRLKTVILGIADKLGDPPSESDAFDPRSLYHIKNKSYPLEKDLKKDVDNFKKKLTKHNVEVLRPNNIDDCNQIFARDLGFVISNMFFLSNIIPNRQDEIEGIKKILNHLDVGLIKLPEFMHIEGGDI